MFNAGTAGDRNEYNVVALAIENMWKNATPQQLAALKPDGERYVYGRDYPKLYDADFRRVNDARTLAGFDVTQDAFTITKPDRPPSERPSGVSSRRSSASGTR